MRRLRVAMASALAAFLLAHCATGDGGSGGYYYDGFWYDDPWWYAGAGCCVDYPGDIGPPPHPEHPIANPPEKPSHPIASPPSRPMPSPRPMATPRGGGGRR